MDRRTSILLAMNRGHRARAYPLGHQAAILHRWSGCARYLWNTALDQYRWGRDQFEIGKVSQCRELTGLRAEFDWLAELPAQTAQQVLAELDLAMQRWRAGLTKYPRRKKKGRSAAVLRFPQGVAVRRFNRHWGEVKLPKLGWLRFRWSRELVGALKHVTLSQRYGTWHVSFCLEQPDVHVGSNGLPPVGVDRGVEIAFMTSDGVPFDQVMWKQVEKARLVVLERRKARQQKTSNRYRRTCQQIDRLHRRAADRRRDFAHKTSTILAKNHGLVAFEKLVIPNMVKSAKGTVEAPGSQVRQKSGLNRAMLDKGWGLTIGHLPYKCAQYGSEPVAVSPRNSSLECAECHHIRRDNRPLRAIFLCVRCGHSDHADRNAARNIVERAVNLVQTGGQPGIGRKASKRLRTWRQPARDAA
jgi:putative transposase